MNWIRVFRAGAAVAAGLCAAAAAQAQEAARVQDAWARATPAGMVSAAGYLTLRGGAVDDRLLSVEADIAKASELHVMRMNGDIMTMRLVESIEVPAGRTVKLQSGGLHIMFVGLKSPLKAGEVFPLRLRFEKAGAVTVQMAVRADAPEPHGHKH